VNWWLTCSYSLLLCIILPQPNVRCSLTSQHIETTCHIGSLFICFTQAIHEFVLLLRWPPSYLTLQVFFLSFRHTTFYTFCIHLHPHTSSNPKYKSIKVCSKSILSNFDCQCVMFYIDSLHKTDITGFIMKRYFPISGRAWSKIKEGRIMTS